MTAVAVSTRVNLSLKVTLETKEALQKLAKSQNRSVHYVMNEIIQKGLAEAKEQDEYQEYVKNRVLAALNRFEKEGSNGVPNEQVFDTVMQLIENKKNDK